MHQRPRGGGPAAREDRRIRCQGRQRGGRGAGRQDLLRTCRVADVGCWVRADAELCLRKGGLAHVIQVSDEARVSLELVLRVLCRCHSAGSHFTRWLHIAVTPSRQPQDTALGLCELPMLHHKCIASNFNKALDFVHMLE